MIQDRVTRLRRLFVVAAAGLLAVGLPGSASAASVGIQLSCYSNPERTTIRNNTNKAFTILRIRSTYQPQDFEPFVLNRTLAPGTSVTYQTGQAASRRVLTRNFIYYNNNELDGVRVKTSIGIFIRAC